MYGKLQGGFCLEIPVGFIGYFSLGIEFQGEGSEGIGICNASIQSIGYAFPCLGRHLKPPTYKKDSLLVHTKAEFELGLVANTRDVDAPPPPPSPCGADGVEFVVNGFSLAGPSLTDAKLSVSLRYGNESTVEEKNVTSEQVETTTQTQPPSFNQSIQDLKKKEREIKKNFTVPLIPPGISSENLTLRLQSERLRSFE
ncbi:unnamed protein product, partial [Darwinula stevensoni]